MDYIFSHIWLLLFLVWGVPLTWFRSKFRKLVYQTDSWTINIQPLFIKELRALFGNMFPNNTVYLRTRNQYRIYLSIYLILFLLYINLEGHSQTNSSNDMGKLIEGSTIPQFSLPDQNGNLFNINSVVGKKNLVIYFYPKDDSPGCTKEACSFRDQFADFEDANAMIIGISSQSVQSHKEFAAKYRLNYTLLSDEGNALRKLFGVPGNLFGLIPGRVTYVVNKEGKVVYLFNSQINAEQHVQEALKVLKAL